MVVGRRRRSTTFADEPPGGESLGHLWLDAAGRKEVQFDSDCRLARLEISNSLVVKEQ